MKRELTKYWFRLKRSRIEDDDVTAALSCSEAPTPSVHDPDLHEALPQYPAEINVMTVRVFLFFKARAPLLGPS